MALQDNRSAGCQKYIKIQAFSWSVAGHLCRRGGHSNHVSNLISKSEDAVLVSKMCEASQLHHSLGFQPQRWVSALLETKTDAFEPLKRNFGLMGLVEDHHR